MDYTKLRTEIDTDPTGLNLIALRDRGSDADIAKALNKVGTTTINKGVVTKEIFFVDFGPQMLGIFSSPDLMTAFGPMLKLLDQVTTLDYSNAIVQQGIGSITQVPALGLTADMVTGILNRPCSRIETLFGVGCTVSSNDVARAYGRI